MFLISELRMPTNISVIISLVVPPANNVKPSPSPSIAPIGAANAGTNPFSDTNAALTMRQVSTPLMTISALIAVLAIAL